MRPWGGGRTPLPIGTWVGGGNVIGDGTGGNMAVIIRFQVLGAPKLASLMMSIDDLSMHSTNPAARPATMVTVNMDRGLADASQWTFQMEADATGVTRGTAMSAKDGQILPLFFSGMRVTGTSPQINFETENVNVVVFTVTASGYLWDGAARSFPGGPLRPIGGIFG